MPPLLLSSSPPKQSALVTGAASGIGRATAELLWAKGFSLCLFDLSPSPLAELQASLESRPFNQQQRCVCVVGDVRDDAAQLRAVQAAQSLGALAAAVVNAGVGEARDFLLGAPLENADTRRVVDIDLTAALTGIKLSAQAMIAAADGGAGGSGGSEGGGKGAIVCVASAAGYFPVPASPVYAAAKGGLVHACRSLAPRLAARGVRLTAVCPQYIDTPLVDALKARGETLARAMMGPLYGQPLLTPGRAAQVIAGALAPLAAAEIAAGRRAIGEAAAAQAGGGGGGSRGDVAAMASSGVLLLLQDGRVVDPFRRRGGAAVGAAAAAVAAGGGGGNNNTRPLPPPPPHQQQQQQPLLRFSPAACRAFAAQSARRLPQSYRKVVVRELSPDFRRATEVRAVPLLLPPASGGGSAPLLPPGHLLVRRLFAGINASDVNWTSGRYHGSRAAAERALPYDAGFESVGVVVAVGGSGNGGGSGSNGSSSLPSFAVGDAVATMESGFAEWAVVPARRCLRVPSPTPGAVALLTSGMTASIALERAAGVVLPARFGFPGPCGGSAGGGGGGPSVSVAPEEGGKRAAAAPPPRVAIVTAAAGGTGQFAVQLLRAAGGWRVVATCSGGADGPKARLLRSLGADAVVDYRAAAADAAGGGLRGALRRACAEVRRSGGGGSGGGTNDGTAGKTGAGADLIYESVGGDTFDACVDALADRGVLVVIGMMDAYAGGWKPQARAGLAEKLLWKSAAVSGFFLLRHAPLWAPHLAALGRMAAAGELKIAVDDGGGDTGGSNKAGGGGAFVGIEAVADAVDRLQGGKSSGKVVVQISRELPEVDGGEKGAGQRSRL